MSPRLRPANDPTLEESQPFLPRRRPVYPQLVIVDDHHATEGEIVRIRRDQVTIGRSHCDLAFPGESLMSASHARIVLREVGPNHWTWILEDTASKNGVFLRLPEFRLLPGYEFLIGGCKAVMHGQGLYHHVPHAEVARMAPFRRAANELQAHVALELMPYSLEVPHRSITIKSKRMELGSLADGEGRIENDCFIEPRHAVVASSEPNVWRIKDLDSLNGLWLRVTSVALTEDTDFMVGEQRFHFQFPRSLL